jgi:aspartyl-tRNA(Asn)/glutamyl-tRNA(Gln) amidotransferase subunit A
VGPIAATVEDLAAAYQVMAGHDPADPWSAQRPATSPAGARPDLNGVRVAVPIPWIDDAPTSEAVAVAFTEAVTRIRSLGATVDTVTDPVLAVDHRLVDLSGAEAAAVHRAWFDEGREYGDDVRERLEYAMGLGSDDYVAAHAWRVEIQRHFEQLFSSHDLVITPATGVTSKMLGQDMVSTIGGDVFYRKALSYFTALVNVAGNPAIVGPLATDGTPPPALQIIAPDWSEHRLLDVAATLVEQGVLRDPGI